MSKRLEQHINISRAAANANKAKGNRHIEILSTLYADPSRFIEELLQNANDAYLKADKTNGKVLFRLIDNTLFVFHDGKPFDEDDLIAITTIGCTTKKDFAHINLIGKFGLGFKSVFAICDEPEIHSGNYHYKIIDFEVLENISSLNTDSFSTCFVFQLKDNYNTLQIVEQGLLKLSADHLLFMNGYQQIEVEIASGSFYLNKKTETIYDKNLHIVIINDSRKPAPEKFLVYNSYNADLQIAFSITTDHNLIFVAEKSNNPVYVYFPTETPSGFAFRMHGRFTTTPTREQVPFSSKATPENIELCKKITTIFRNLPLQLKKNQLLNVSFWKCMPVFCVPITDLSSPLHKAVVDGLMLTLNHDSVMPTHNQKFMKLNQLIATEPELSALLKASDVQLLFGRKGIIADELSKAIQKTGQLKQYFSQLKFIDEKDFAFAISSKPAFFKQKNIHWHHNFLKYIASKTHLWNKHNQNMWFSLREKPFILLQSLKVEAPFRNDMINIYQYQQGLKNVPMIHKSLVQNQQLQDFFNQLEIPLPDILPEFFKKVITTFTHGQPTYKNTLKAWSIFIRLYANAHEHLRLYMIETIKKHKCVPVVLSQSSDKMFVQPDKAYFRSVLNITFFNNIEIPFVEQDFIERLQWQEFQESQILQLLSATGVHFKPAFLPFQNLQRISELQQFKIETEKNGFTVVHEEFTDFTIDGLDNFLNEPSLEKSLVVAKLLSGQYPMAEIRLETYTQIFTKQCMPHFLMQLLQQPWLYDNNEHLKSNTEIRSLHPLYFQADVNLQKIIALFDLKIQHQPLSDEEMLLLQSFREHKKISDQPFHLASLFNAKTDFLDFPELSIIEPLLVEMNEEANTVKNITTQPIPHLLSEQINLLHHVHASDVRNLFLNHPAQLHAIKIVHKMLIKLYGAENVSVVTDSEQPFSFAISSETINSIFVLVSGLKIWSTFFLFPKIKTEQSELASVYLYAVDNLHSITPVIYRKKMHPINSQDFPCTMHRMG